MAMAKGLQTTPAVERGGGEWGRVENVVQCTLKSNQGDQWKRSDPHTNGSRMTNPGGSTTSPSFLTIECHPSDYSELLFYSGWEQM